MLDLSDILAAPVDDPHIERVVALLTEMQRGVNALTDILVDHRVRIETLERENRLLRARLDIGAARPMAKELFKWPN